MVTISDIAKSLGVTPSTVSRALAGSPRVKESTRKAISEAAASMGYERNEPASSLRKGHSNVVGIVVPRINRAFFSSAISGAETVLNEHGYSVIICQTHENLDDEIKALKTLKSNRVAGVLISHASSSTSGDHILENVRQGTVLVQFDRVFSDLPGPKIVNDNFHGAYEGTHHLIEQGYKRIGHIAGFRDTEAYMDRLNGYKQALTDMGIEIDEDIIFYDSIVEESGYKAGKIALERGCDAIYCAGDFSALGAYIAVKESGVRIPDDFGIIGTANEFFTTIMSPSISSIAQHPYEIGRRAAQAFLTSLKPGANVGKIVVAMEIKARESSLRKTGR
ncbi:MAG: LacI family DNA-binding transcriptional regulator [Bacteroidales bacterium]|nr:LacI family DNA-binding transcriptional regulator [Bacteroidales bacterium]